jgi:hypothetical protein
MNPNGFSATTRTLIGKNRQSPSPWLKKLTRYTIIMNPGDVLINPPWFWHGFLNLPVSSDSSNTSNGNTCENEDKKDLVIGSAVRYSEKEVTEAALRVNSWWTLNTFVVLLWFCFTVMVAGHSRKILVSIFRWILPTTLLAHDNNNM